ncbi:MAG TPA: AAA family ATPase [Propionicimonas sp.]|nr:AAA family ATPase [Propionicimonas sp.]
MPEPAELDRQLASANELLDARARALDLAERRLADARADARTLSATNQKLNSALTTAREALETMRVELDALATPPSSFGLVLDVGGHTADVATAGRVLRCALSPEVAPESLAVGTRVLLNEAMLVIGLAEPNATGETARLIEVLPFPGHPSLAGPAPALPEPTPALPEPTPALAELDEARADPSSGSGIVHSGALAEPTPALAELDEAQADPSSGSGTVCSGTPPKPPAEELSEGRVPLQTVPEELSEGRVPLQTVPEELSEGRGKRHEGPPPPANEHPLLLVTGSAGDEAVLAASASIPINDLRPGTTLLVDRRAGLALAIVPRSEVADLTLEEVPDVSYADIGGLGDQIEQIRDAVELPFQHRELFAEFGLRPPKGVLLYGPPGCGKTMIAKAVANSAGSHFLNIKGPELLDKYVGETERQIRAIFTRAKEHATSGRPVIVFFDEMDALFRTRGSGVSSDVEATIVPQLLAEIDGVEGLANVIVIGATNREDLIDPAILRPGRLDVKIKLDRPNQAGAAEILSRYLTAETPLNQTEALRQAQGTLAGAQGAWVGAQGANAGTQGTNAGTQGTDAGTQGTDAGTQGAEAVAQGTDAGTQRTLAEPVEAFRRHLIETIVERLYARTDANRFIEVTYAGGDKEMLYVGDFVSGAMLAGVVDRAKKAAIKDLINGGERGLRTDHVKAACAAEIGENEELPNTTNPDDWARVSGRKGERIVFLRTLVGARALNP